MGLIIAVLRTLLLFRRYK